MRSIRNRFLQFMADGLVVVCALAAAYLIRWPGELPPRDYIRQFLLIAPYLVLIRISLFAGFGVYRLIWRYVSLRDMPRILLAMGSGTAALVAVRYTMPTLLQVLPVKLNPKFATVPYGVLVAELMLTSVGIIAMRGLWRVIKERDQGRQPGALRLDQAPLRKVFLVGAGAAGAMVARQARENHQVGFQVMGFLDDDPATHGTLIHGYRVLGGPEELGAHASRLEVDLVVLTMTSFPGTSVRRIMDLARAAQLDVKIIPAFHELSQGIFNLSKIRDVAIHDLLGRAPVHLEEETVRAFVAGRDVLVTGAGGSIGAEICRQVCRYRPGRLFLLDQAENPLFHIHRELLAHDPELELVAVVGSVASRRRMKQVMAELKPDVIFHAAAHKHVPLMESNPGEAIRNNVLGSRVMAELSEEAGAEAFVLVSTDKAVNPTSVMGATKRLAEMVVQSLASSSRTRFLTVRFGNVLDSEGSAVPLFKEQIARGGPVTVTHPEMKRYFMTITEASQLVLQAAAMGEGGEIFILEMGEAVRIVDLARDLITLSGFIPERDIAITYTGMRPGEKLHEEINLSEEHAAKTKHPRIWIGKSTAPDRAQVAALVDSLLACSTEEPPDALKARMAQCVPEYVPSSGGEGEP